jgi:hypothetical protein
MVVYDEMKALQNNNTWELTTLPDEKKNSWMQMVVYCEI